MTIRRLPDKANELQITAVAGDVVCLEPARHPFSVFRRRVFETEFRVQVTRPRFVVDGNDADNDDKRRRREQA